MRNPALFFGGIALAVIGIALGVYYLIPGIHHILTSDTNAHLKHAAAFFALAVIGIIGALMGRPRSA